MQELYEQRAGRCHARPHRPPGPARRRAVEAGDCVAPLARPGRRLQPGRPQEHRRGGVVLLLRDELITSTVSALPPPRAGEGGEGEAASTEQAASPSLSLQPKSDLS